MDYWNKLGERGPLSVYLRDWLRTPEWVWQKAKKLEEEIVALRQERDAVMSGARKFIEALRDDLGLCQCGWSNSDHHASMCSSYDRRNW